MNTIIAILFLIAFVAFWTWVFWGPISMIYHAVMIAACALIWTTITVFEVLSRASKAMIRIFLK
jgi:hypothetical protein